MFDLSYDDKEIQRLVFHKYSVLVIKHAAISIWRRNNAKKRSGNVIDYDIEWMGEDDIYPSDNVIFDEKGHSCTIQAEWLYDAMLRLDDKYKSVLILKYWYGFLQKEIAEMLHASRRTITSWKSRAFKSIKDYGERIGKTWHYKQRHTAKRVYDRLNEMYGDFEVCYSTVAAAFRRIKSEVYYVCREYAPLRHIPGEAQVDLGNCGFVENGVKYKGYYIVMSFTYSNIAFCQLLKSKNIQCIVQGIKNIFEFISGVSHEITFDNESGIVKCLGEKITKRVENELFLRFKNHYDFRCEYCNSHSPNQKGHVEGKIGYLRWNLFVPQPDMQNIDEYNKELLNQCMRLHNRKHHRTKKSIIEMFDCDRQALLPLPEKDFEAATCIVRKVDREGQVRFNGQRIYYLEPEYANKKVQVKLSYNKVIFYYKELNKIAKFDRLYGDKNYTAIHWEQWLPTLSRRPNSLFHSSFADMFTERLRQFLLGGTAKLRGVYMKALCELIKTMTLDKALNIADEAAEQAFEEIDDILQLAGV